MIHLRFGQVLGIYITVDLQKDDKRQLAIPCRKLNEVERIRDLSYRYVYRALQSLQRKYSYLWVAGSFLPKP